MSALDLHLAMTTLARSRPVFHSEADFQHSLAWTLRTLVPSVEVRLERPLAEVLWDRALAPRLLADPGKKRVRR